ncbi:MAG: hypothetical protein IKU46_05440 [Peptococcaceae bacterium]|nr:hypothetical protein [Peptococcaceae bacterium]
MLDDSYKNGQVSDAELDALLAKWAEEEIEPPAGFHEQTMKRLRAEQILQVQPMKKNTIITLFAKQRRWTSIAAAAVLMLFCVPMVQGQFGSDATESISQQQMQVDRSTEGKAETDITADSSSRSGASDGAASASMGKNQPVSPAQTEQSAGAAPDSNVLNKDAVMRAVAITESENTGAGNDNIAVAQMPMEGEDVPLVAAFSLEDGENAADNSRTRMAPEPQEEFSCAAGEDETLETLEQKLNDLQDMMAQYQAQLEENPDDTNLQELVKEQQKAMEELKKKIEEMKQQQAE